MILFSCITTLLDETNQSYPKCSCTGKCLCAGFTRDMRKLNTFIDRYWRQFKVDGQDGKVIEALQRNLQKSLEDLFHLENRGARPSIEDDGESVLERAMEMGAITDEELFLLLAECA